MTSVSVVIPNLNSPLVGAVVAAIRQQTVREQVREIIVVGSDSNGQIHPDGCVQLIRPKRPLSAAAARNRGAAAARGEWLLFVDADCLLSPTTLERMLETSPRFDMLVAGVVPETESYWVLCSNLMAFPANLVGDQAGERSSLPSLCLLLKRKTWAAMNGFDESFVKAAGEDMDLSFRMRRAGYRLGCEPAAAVYHRPARRTPASCWYTFVQYGMYWRRIRAMHRDFLPPAPLSWVSRQPSALGAALAVPLAVLFVLRLMARQRHLWPFWYALPGMFLLRLAFYQGMRWADAMR